MKAAEADILCLPDVGGTGPGHWLSRWEGRLSTARLVEQVDWDTPVPSDWAATLIAHAKVSAWPVILVAHGCGVLCVARAARHLPATVRAAFLVAPTDAERADGSAVTRAFAPIARDRLPFPSLLIASRTDLHCGYDAGPRRSGAPGGRSSSTPARRGTSTPRAAVVPGRRASSSSRGCWGA